MSDFDEKFDDRDGNVEDVVPGSNADSESTKTVHEYNRIFDYLVLKAKDPQNNVVGLLAYGRYKLKKRNWFKRFNEKHERPPKEGEVENFLLAWDDTTLNDELDQAELAAEVYSEDLLRQKQESIKAEAVQRYLGTTLDKKTEAIQTHIEKKIGWKASVIASIVGTIVYSVIVAGIVVLFSLANPESVSGKILKAFFTDKQIEVIITGGDTSHGDKN